MNEVNVIDGSELIKHLRVAKLPSDLKEIDPLGVNVIFDEVAQLNNTIRLSVLFKVVDEVEPIVGNLTLPTNVYNRIKRKVSFYVH